MVAAESLDPLVARFTIGAREALQSRWASWPKDLSRNQIHEAVAGLLARQVTLACQLVQRPTTWNGHLAPVVLRTMIDTHITLAWILRDPLERSKKYILYGLGQMKLEIEHRKARWTPDSAPDKVYVEALERWVNSQRFTFLTEVNLGSWSEMPVRKMAEEADLLDFYNYTYTPFSAAAHSAWHHVARYNLVDCGNPLHRYHRVPVVSDAPTDPHYAVLAAKYMDKSLSAFDSALNVGAPAPTTHGQLEADLQALLSSESPAAEHGVAQESRTTLAEAGFLSDETDGVVAAVRQRYAPWLSEIRALNRLVVASQYEIKVHPESPQEVTCAALYIRSLAHAQAAVILLERGMAASARAMARCALDALFSLAACAGDAKMALSVLDSDQFDRVRRAKHLTQVNDAKAQATVDQDEVRAVRDAALRNIEDLGAEQLTRREVARRAGLEDLYLTAYSYLSGAVHSSISDLDDHFEVDAQGKMCALLTDAVVEKLDGFLLIIGETMVCAVRAASKVFPLSVVDACERHAEALQHLAEARLQIPPSGHPVAGP